VVSASGTFEATTEDVGGHGCQLVSPRLVRKGEPVQLLVSHEGVENLRVSGRVAWASDRAPWRLGIAYDESSLPQSAAWFEALLGSVAGMGAFRRIPDQIPVDSIVYLASPPRFLVDFSRDEAAILRATGSGTSLAEIRAQLRDRWPQLQHALFSLLAHQHLTLTRGASVHPDAWRKILSEVEASLAVESLRAAPATSFAPPAPVRPGSAPTRPDMAAAPPAPAPAPAPARSPPGPVPAAAVQPYWPSPTSPSWPAAGAEMAWPAAPAGPTPPEVEAAGVEVPSADSPESWLVPAADLVPAAWPSRGSPRGPVAVPRGLTRGLDEGAAWSATPPPLTGGFSPGPARSAEAQGCYERAMAELEAGRLAGATALLRRALALAPGDAEIAGALARVAEQRKG
jgi:hypothetical protein